MNWAHLKTFVWLRWRLVVNQIARSGPGGEVLAALFTLLIVCGGALGLGIGFLVAYTALDAATPSDVMIAWDWAIIAFAFFWLTGLISELQRSDALSLDRFLHLPVSPGSAFLINYLGSSVSLSLVLMLPAMIGLAAGLALTHGTRMLVLFPLIAAFFLMMTAVTYQFRGWLASMMTSPRRRRAILTAAPILLVLIIQLPNLWNNFSPAARERRSARAEARRTIARLNEELREGRISQEEFEKRRPAPPAPRPGTVSTLAPLGNIILPPGWLAYGAEAAARGRVWPTLAAMLGMGLIGAASLRRAYGTTLRLYRGDFDTGRRRDGPQATQASAGGAAASARSPSTILERRLPWVSEQASAVAMASFRSWMRAPEMKLMLLSPVIMLIVFSGAFSGPAGGSPGLMRPLTVSGIAAFMLIMSMMGPVGNQFGYDRSGFRAFVLSPLRRRDLLVGKNLALLPFALGTMLAVVAIAQWFNPMRIDHLAALLLQLVPMYLQFCISANLLSIVGPLALKPGSGMPAPRQGVRNLYPIVFMLASFIPLGLTLIPLGMEALLSRTQQFDRFPAYLMFGVVQLAVTIWLYRVAVEWQGRLLQRREQQVLDIVGSRAE